MLQLFEQRILNCKIIHPIMNLLHKDTKWIPFPMKYVFYTESLINFITVVMCLAFPQIFLSQLINTSQNLENSALFLVRWYGVLLFVLTLIMGGLLVKKNEEGFRIVMVAYLIGDGLQIWVSLQLVVSLQESTAGTTLSIGITLVLIIFRILFLLGKGELEKPKRAT